MKLLAPQNLIGILFAASILYLLDSIGFWIGHLTHPFWSSKVNTIGMIIGSVISVGLLFAIAGQKRRSLVALILMAVLAIIAYFVTAHFKEVFAASYAEDALAGKIWYFGFMAFIASAYGALAMVPAYLVAKLEN